MEKEKAMKTCKHCQSEIPKKAKVCPVCRKKQGGIGKFILLAFVAVFIIAAFAGGESGNEEKKEFYAVGETANINGLNVVVSKYYESNGKDFSIPEEGNVFVIVEFEFENNSKNDVVISSMMSFDAYADDYAVNQSLTGLLDTGDKQQLDGTVASGKKLDGVIAYELPEDWESLEIHYTESILSSDVFKFIIEK